MALAHPLFTATLLHQGFVLDVAVEDFLNLNQNDGLGTYEISGERTYSGPLFFNDNNSFRDAGVGISRNRGYQNLFAGYFRALEDGVYEFQLKRHDDSAAIWIDLDQDGKFEEDTYTKERVSSRNDHRTVYLREGFVHVCHSPCAGTW